ncbi:ABC transporter ATP-binding protein [Nakamurella leprariae]|uniref:ABC transporter ATP-binding protein n=1 Tax=Nakamurella leprariae TaxID=2803911 RepID=A0A938YIF2_9ACTN|nr:dipeptide/oligopeptide/nickel ABC transporter ATP-binding protein [Nakamurella leprariae]MBM9468734.1 ABC transporter ATP-binding protein [Nakamurella leprariae]
MLTATGVVAGYGEHTVLRSVDLTVTPGRITGLQGPSGSGKSTLARVVALLHPRTAGTVTVDGRSVTGSGYLAPAELRRRIGMVFQSPRAATDPRWTLRQVIAEPLGAARRSATRQRVAELAEQFQLTDDLLDRYPHQVSDGQLQRACLARAVALRPAYLVCDEATAMLDPSTTATIAQLVRGLADAGTGVLAVSHDRALLTAWADHVLDLHDLHADARTSWES